MPRLCGTSHEACARRCEMPWGFGVQCLHDAKLRGLLRHKCARVGGDGCAPQHRRWQARGPTHSRREHQSLVRAAWIERVRISSGSSPITVPALCHGKSNKSHPTNGDGGIFRNFRHCISQIWSADFGPHGFEVRGF